MSRSSPFLRIPSPHESCQRRLRLEVLEDRRLLATFTVANLLDGPVNAAGDLFGSLRQAVWDANQNPGADEIEWLEGSIGTITLTEGELRITDDLAIIGPGATAFTVDASGNDPTPDFDRGDGSRVFHFDDGIPSVTFDGSISGLTLTGGDVPGDGGAVWNSENLQLADVVVRSNVACNFDGFDCIGGSGGGILNRGTLTVTDSTISGNSAAANGGGIYNYGDITAHGTTISGNVTSAAGGGIFNALGRNLTVYGSAISGNSANFNGGGLYNFGGTLTAANTIISGNMARAGGGITAIYGSLTVIDSTLVDNSATVRSGGGIYHANSQAIIEHSVISSNSARQGGGITHGQGTMTVSDSTIADNSADTNGGGVFVPFDGGLTVTGSSVSDNSANSRGGGMFIGGASFVSVIGSTVSGNAAHAGGGIGSVSGGISVDLTVTDSTIADNKASSSGGGIYNSEFSYLTVSDSTISRNAAQDGGGIFNAGPTEVRYSTITANTTTLGLGSGVASVGDYYTRTEVISSIIAGNERSDVDVFDGTLNSFLSDGYNLIGFGNALGAFNNNDQINVNDPMLGDLADNGGPTKTHAVLSGSPALNAGDPSFVPPPHFDQRGAPFTRVFDGRIDIGAFESQPFAVDGDFVDDGLYDCLDIDALVAEIAAGTNGLAYDLTGDGLVDLADREAWLVEGGANNPTRTGGNPFLKGDANLDGVVDGPDFIIWNSNKYTNVAAWCRGDFSADGIVNGQDFLIWKSNKFQSSAGGTQMVLPQGPAASHESVTSPGPAGLQGPAAPLESVNPLDGQVNDSLIVKPSKPSASISSRVKSVDSVFAARHRDENSMQRPEQDIFGNLIDALRIS